MHHGFSWGTRAVKLFFFSFLRFTSFWITFNGPCSVQANLKLLLIEACEGIARKVIQESQNLSRRHWEFMAAVSPAKLNEFASYSDGALNREYNRGMCGRRNAGRERACLRGEDPKHAKIVVSVADFWHEDFCSLPKKSPRIKSAFILTCHKTQSHWSSLKSRMNPLIMQHAYCLTKALMSLRLKV